MFPAVVIVDSDQAAVTELTVLAVTDLEEVSEAGLEAEAAAAVVALVDKQEIVDMAETVLSEAVSLEAALTDEALEVTSVVHGGADMAAETAHTVVDFAEAHRAWARLVDFHLIRSAA